MLNIVTNSIGFKGIYYSPSKDFFNNDQMRISEHIISELQKKDKNNGISKEEKYKKLGYDFLIVPNDRFLDSDVVYLYAKTVVKPTIHGQCKNIESKNFITSCSNSKIFNINDVDNFIKNDNLNINNCISKILIVGIVGFLTILGIKSVKRNIFNTKKTIPSLMYNIKEPK